MFIKKRVNQLFILITLLLTANLFAEEVGITEVYTVEEPTLNEQKKEVYDPMTPIQFSFFAPLQIFSENHKIFGLRLTLPYGVNRSLYGLDIGLVNKLDTLYGLGVSALYSVHTKEMYGVNIAGMLNLSTGNHIGFSMAGIYNEAKKVEGIQIAALHNQAKTLNGVQISLFNYCHKMNGVQIGLLNYCKDQPFRYTLLFNFWDSATKDKNKKK